MATEKQMRESILGKLKDLLKKGKKPPKSVEKEINKDPKLKDKWEKLQKSSAQADKDMDDLLKLKGIK
jgi:hypothetical protein